MHGVVRRFAAMGVRQGDVQARMMMDPAVRADPVPFYDELRERVAGDGPLIRCRVSYVTVDHALAQELLRSDDFRVIKLGSNLPGPLRRLTRTVRALADAAALERNAGDYARRYGVAVDPERIVVTPGASGAHMNQGWTPGKSLDPQDRSLFD